MIGLQERSANKYGRGSFRANFIKMAKIIINKIIREQFDIEIKTLSYPNSNILIHILQFLAIFENKI